MGVGRETVTIVIKLPKRMNMDQCSGKTFYMMEKLMMDLFGDSVPFGNRHFRVHGHVDFSLKTVADPSSAGLRHAPHASGVASGVIDFVQHLWFNPVEHPSKNCFGGLKDDTENGDGDEEADHGVRQGKAQLDADGAQEDGKAGEPVRSGVISVGHQGRALDLFADANTEHSHGLVPDESNKGSGDHGPQMSDGLGMEESSDRFGPRNGSA